MRQTSLSHTTVPTQRPSLSKNLTLSDHVREGGTGEQIDMSVPKCFEQSGVIISLLSVRKDIHSLTTPDKNNTETGGVNVEF